jgi:hypothetical protein
MDFYDAPKSSLRNSENFEKKRWNMILAFQLLSKPYLVFLVVSIILTVWYNSYVSMIEHVSQLGIDVEEFSREDFLIGTFSLSLIPGSIVVLVVTSILPVAFVSYFQTKKSAYLSQLLWTLIIISLFALVFLAKG